MAIAVTLSLGISTIKTCNFLHRSDLLIKEITETFRSCNLEDTAAMLEKYHKDDHEIDSIALKEIALERDRSLKQL